MHHLEALIPLELLTLLRVTPQVNFVVLAETVFWLMVTPVYPHALLELLNTPIKMEEKLALVPLSLAAHLQLLLQEEVHPANNQLILHQMCKQHQHQRLNHQILERHLNQLYKVLLKPPLNLPLDLYIQQAPKYQQVLLQDAPRTHSSMAMSASAKLDSDSLKVTVSP